jgi:DNA-binding GntR family transcriptional regulator
MHKSEPGGVPRRPNRTRLSDKAYERLRQRIFDNELPPGYRALEEELARRLRMSRTPVHEALIRLQNEGLVRLEPRRGVTVLAVSVDDMQEIYGVVTAVETAAAELLAARRPDDRALAPLERAVVDMERALAAEDLVAWSRADERFHRALLELCGNRRLAEVGLRLRDQVRRVRMITLPARPKPVVSTEAHRATFEAIRAGDTDRARELHRAQRIRGSRQMTELLERSPVRTL